MYLPTGQKLQNAVPASDEYLPGPQGMHSSSSCNSIPEGLSGTLRIGPSCPAGHFSKTHCVPPGGHSRYRFLHRQAAALVLPDGACEFARQSVQTEDPAPAYVFATQVVQDEAPAAANLPPTQISQCVCPSTALYLPASQLTHVLLSTTRNLPGLHNIHVVDPSTENVPVEQLTQAALPEVFLYVPALQGAHAAPEYPTLHRQASKLVLPTGELRAPAHVKHAEFPRATLYVFTGQTVQGPPSGPENPGAH